MTGERLVARCAAAAAAAAVAAHGQLAAVCVRSTKLASRQTPAASNHAQLPIQRTSVCIVPRIAMVL
jgi:hypothetical protein